MTETVLIAFRDGKHYIDNGGLLSEKSYQQHKSSHIVIHTHAYKHTLSQELAAKEVLLKFIRATMVVRNAMSLVVLADCRGVAYTFYYG